MSSLERVALRARRDALVDLQSRLAYHVEPDRRALRLVADELAEVERRLGCREVDTVTLVHSVPF